MVLTISSMGWWGGSSSLSFPVFPASALCPPSQFFFLPHRILIEHLLCLLPLVTLAILLEFLAPASEQQSS
jgi:hypothetical protein